MRADLVIRERVLRMTLARRLHKIITAWLDLANARAAVIDVDAIDRVCSLTTHFE